MGTIKASHRHADHIKASQRRADDKSKLPSIIAATLLALLSSTVSHAQITANKAWVRAAPPDTFVLAAYAELTNKTDQAIALTQIVSPQFVRIELHETVLKGDKSVMRKIDKLTIAPGGNFSFSPNGPHIMLIEPRQMLPPGTAVTLSFQFDNGSAVTVEAQVQEDAESTGK